MSGNPAVERVPELDLLRFIAAILVMLFHFCGWGGLATPFRFGWMGVPLFFMISGFVILWSATGSAPTKFVVSRASRLYPTFWVCATITAVLMLEHVTLKQYVANMTFAHFVLDIDSLSSVYWTLYYEIKFYVLVFLLLAFRQLKRVELWTWAWLGASFVPGPIAEKLTLDEFGPLFVSGMACFLIWRSGPTLSRLALFAVSGVAGTVELTKESLLRNYGVPGEVYPVVALMVVFSLGFLAIALKWTALRSNHYVLGSLTYPLYLIHAPLGDAVWKQLSAGTWLKVLVVSAISIAAAAVVARYAERRWCKAMSVVLTGWISALMGVWKRQSAAGPS